MKIMQRSWGRAVEKGNAPFKCAPAEGTDFFRRFGWREAEFRAVMLDARRLDRQMTMMLFWRFLMRFYPARLREEFKRMSGIVLLERSHDIGGL